MQGNIDNILQKEIQINFYVALNADVKKQFLINVNSKLNAFNFAIDTKPDLLFLN